MKSVVTVLVSCLFLVSCASGPAPTPLVLQRMAASGVDSRTYAKIHAGRVLSYSDILGLVDDKIPDAAIVSYLKSTHARSSENSATRARDRDWSITWENPSATTRPRNGARPAATNGTSIRISMIPTTWAPRLFLMRSRVSGMIPLSWEPGFDLLVRGPLPCICVPWMESNTASEMKS